MFVFSGSAEKKSKVSCIWISCMSQRKPAFKFAVCINNADYPASLELHKIYRVLPDEDAATDGDIRVVDESGEDYLYPAKRFVPIVVPDAVQKSLLKAA